MKKVILDTNVYTGLLAGDREVLEIIARADRVYLSVVVLGELYFGFLGGGKQKRNLRLLESFLEKSTVEILNIDREMAEVFAEIKHKLQKEGTPIPINDLWLSAQAFQTGSRLITYDRHFLKIPGLLLKKL
ncbi:type II toxin-antitoxin system VapC family toxin [Patescibacteria group bacterium]